MLYLIVSLIEVLTIGMLIPFIGILTGDYKLQDILSFTNLSNFSDIKENDQVILITIIFLSLIILSGLFRLYVVKKNANFAFSLGHRFASYAFSSFINISHATYINLSRDQIVSILSNKVNSIIYNCALPILTMTSSVFLVVAINTFLIFKSSGDVLIIALLLCASYYIVTMFYKKIMVDNGKLLARQNTQIFKIINESYECFRDLYIENNQGVYAKQYERADTILRGTQKSMEIAVQYPKIIIEGIGILLLIVFVLYVKPKDAASTLFFIDFGVIVFGFQKMVPLAQNIYNSWVSLKYGNEAVKESLSLLDFKNNDESLNKNFISFKKKTKINFNSQITFQNVSFKYQNSKDWILDSVNFTIQKGDFILLKGVSGSGKSTILDLIMGNLRPSKGNIYVDGTNLNNIERKEWVKNISFSPQKTLLINDTIMANIAFDNVANNINFKDIVNSTKKANIHKEIKKLDNGYYTVVNSLGDNISGGQKQRLGLSRSFFRDKNILIMDEPTSALDLNNEKIFYDTLSKEVRNNKTILIISHKKDADLFVNKILHIRDRKIYQTLVKKC